MNTLTKLITAGVKFSGPIQLVSGNLGLISDPHINFQKSRNGLRNHIGPENINYTIVKYGKYFLQPALGTNTSCSEDKYSDP